MHWTKIKTAEDVCAAFPELMEELRREISIASPAADAPAACREILQHYRSGNTAAWLRSTAPGTDRPAAVTKNLICPDGAATELTSTYHGDTRGMIDSSAKTLLQAGRELPAGLAGRLPGHCRGGA